MIEYEYSYKVKSLEPYINYCMNNNYDLMEENHQVRTIYRKNDGTIARITIKEKDGKVVTELDFKEDIFSDEKVIERKESKAISFNDDEAIYSILEFLGYQKDNVLDRIRITYQKDDVKFELDKYKEPSETFVIGIEGDKNKVNEVYKKIESINMNYEIVD